MEKNCLQCKRLFETESERRVYCTPYCAEMAKRTLTKKRQKEYAKVRRRRIR